KGSPRVAEFGTPTESIPWALSYRKPARIEAATVVKNDMGDLNKDGFNESEGCHVLEGPGPLRFTYERGAGAGFAPAFKGSGWKGKAAQRVKMDGKEVPAAAAVIEGKLLLQVLGRLEKDKAVVEVQEGK